MQQIDLRALSQVPGPQHDCPSCFARIRHNDATCPHCQVQIERWIRTHTYLERLIHALKHPDSESRIASIIALGNHGDPLAALPLVACAMNFPADTTQNLEIMRAISRLPSSREKRVALTVLGEHPSRIIRQEAQRQLG